MSVITNNTIQPSSGQALTIKDEGGTASITVATNGEATFAETLKITNGKGIDFSAVSGSTSGSSSAVLDDYEEGSMVQYLNVGGSDVSTTIMNSLTNHSYTYTKIGNICTVGCRFSTNVGGGQADIGSGTIMINLPYTSHSSSWRNSTASIYEGGGSGWVNNARVRISNGASKADIYKSTDHTNALQASGSSERHVLFTITYKVA